MTYIHVTRTRGASVRDYQAVGEHLGDAPIAGQTSHWVGEVDGSLVVVDAWESKADADRFAAERLFPAFSAAGYQPFADTEIIAFEPSAEVSAAHGATHV